MSLKLMASGLAAVVLCAVASALAPAVATSEVRFEAPSAGTLDGQRVGPGRFLVSGFNVGCNEALFGGPVVPGSSTIEIEPEFIDCRLRALTGFRADFFQEVCPFKLHGLKPVRPDTWKADLDIVCSGEFIGIGWDFFETEAVYREVDNTCFVRIGEQKNAGTAELTNLGAREGIEVRFDLDGFDYTLNSSRGETPSLLCGTMTDPTYYRGTIRVTAKDARGRPMPLAISG